jgi:prepilin-type processing-associated H-X9-DG protein
MNRYLGELALIWENCSGLHSFHDGVNAAFCDGSVHFLAEDIEPAIVRGAASRAGGEPINRGSLAVTPGTDFVGARRMTRRRLEGF